MTRERRCYMRKESLIVAVVLVLMAIGLVLACEPPTPNPTPVVNSTPTVITNNVSVESNNTNVNEQNQTQQQNQTQSQTQETHVNNTNINNYNPTNNFNPIIIVSMQTANNQQIDLELDQSQTSNVWPETLEVGAITPYGKILSIKNPNQEVQNATTAVPMENTGLPIGALIVAGTTIVALVGASKAGILAKVGL